VKSSAASQSWRTCSGSRLLSGSSSGSPVLNGGGMTSSPYVVHAPAVANTASKPVEPSANGAFLIVPLSYQNLYLEHRPPPLLERLMGARRTTAHLMIGPPP